MNTEYKSRRPQVLSDKEAQVWGTELQRLGRNIGGVTPQAVLNEAKRGESPLHSFFEWDDARAAQAGRFGDGKTLTNSRMTHRQVEQFCPLDSASEMMLKQAMAEFGLSARAHDKVCKVARTIADLASCEDIGSEHIAEAISYRKLDRKL